MTIISKNINYWLLPNTYKQGNNFFFVLMIVTGFYTVKYCMLPK